MVSSGKIQKYFSTRNAALKESRSVEIFRHARHHLLDLKAFEFRQVGGEIHELLVHVAQRDVLLAKSAELTDQKLILTDQCLRIFLYHRYFAQQTLEVQPVEFLTRQKNKRPVYSSLEGIRRSYS